ncbi:MAG: tRNA pseudouridine(38-40) synthase TruA [Clostridia bacterium]|nr:tRNA pseudouridine(38-40) synthase TruA [Clostridia bacterium]
MRNVVIKMMFDGAGYHGFQRQNNGITVQETVEEAIFAVTREKTPLIGCSRTDAGVHAKNYVAMFATNTKIPMSLLPKAINSALPEDIRVMGAQEAPPGFHPIASAVEKTYEYTIVNRRCMDVFMRDRAWFYPKPLQTEEMCAAAKHFLGEHDFAAFMAAGGSAKTSVRTIKTLSVLEEDGIIRIRISANGFLYNMVRIITGTLVCVGNGRLQSADIPAIIASCDRRRAGMTAPPHGLMLLETVYADFTVGGSTDEKA